MVDLLGNTAVDWFCILSYFRLDTLHVGIGMYMHVYACVLKVERVPWVYMCLCVLMLGTTCFLVYYCNYV